MQKEIRQIQQEREDQHKQSQEKLTHKEQTIR